MAVSFNVPKSPAKSIFTIDNFQGVDFTNSPANIDPSKSPNSVNMIRDVPGKVRKCMGYHTIDTYLDGDEEPLRINGYHRKRGDEYGLIHAGTNIYRNKVLLYSDANDARSKSWQFEDRLYILDGKKLLVYYEETENDETTYHVAPVSDDAYIPTLTISKDPEGGGESYEDLNLLTPGFIEQFL